MSEVEFIPNDKGSFVILKQNKRLAEMVVSVVDQELTVYHTGVLEQLQGQGLGKQLFEGMCRYARQNQLKVTTYCPFVKARFQEEFDRYADIWKKEQPQLRSL